MFSSCFMLFPTLNFFFCKQKFWGEGGGVLWLKNIYFFFRKTILSHFTFYAIFNITKKKIEKCPFTYWLNGRWFLQIVDIGDSWNLYPLYPLFPCSDFVSQMGGWFVGGCNVFLTFYAIYNISRNKNSGNTKKNMRFCTRVQSQ